MGPVGAGYTRTLEYSESVCVCVEGGGIDHHLLGGWTRTHAQSLHFGGVPEGPTCLTNVY